ncbi:YggT family protein [Schleiferilactobacillus harbinensis]|uniref:YggT family protein n=1 Tax=Schleiferilactobacillus harbinensis TaxID=304207 RepID=UPI0007B92641|nr:YggT family protein [Schleiferilactobacillus harbinensis]MCI1688235.1 YggT family protein [Schleiferilactobacillus harbinensis]MCI1782759.1 YggT family protein [Schleiferilactobacillus harbinensis]MCI1851732.1 YggT family protein [Schleiferilactobacillus harbinensis]
MVQLINVLNIISTIVGYAIDAYSALIIIYALLTWIPSVFNTRVGNLIARVVEPYLNFFNRFIPPIFGISMAPLFALLGLVLFGRGLNIIFRWILQLAVGY